LGTLRGQRTGGLIAGVLAVAFTVGATAVTVAAREAVDASMPPPSFARAAALARAAVVTIRTPRDDRLLPRESAVENDDTDNDREPPATDEALEEVIAALLRSLRQRTLGAGVIVDPSGLVVTSALAVQLSDEFEVAMSDGTTPRATMVGIDRHTGIALLSLERTREYPSLSFASSDPVDIGDWVLAIGAPFGLEGTVTAGVITAVPSAQGTPGADRLQTDAAVARGNLGGPLVNLQGEIVALNTVVLGDALAYATPARTVRAVYLELRERGRVRRAWLGVTTQSLSAALARALRTADASGVVIVDVVTDGPAAKAGLRSGDVVVAVAGVPVSSRAALEHAVVASMPGRTLALKIRREAREMTLTARLGEEPDAFATPAALARARQVLGLKVRAIAPDLGVVAEAVDPDSPADIVGIEPGDVIREVNHRAVRNIADFEAAVRTITVRRPVLMLIQRGPAALYVALTSTTE
jgi:serine protease Do